MKAIRDLVLNRNFWPFALVMHALVLSSLYLKFGINFSNESEKYLAIAERLNFANFREELRYLWGYSFYILFLALFLKMGFSVYVILVIQYLFSLTGFYLFYKFILSRSFFSKVYARLYFLVILTCPVIIYWQLTFYTETFFLALVMTSTYFVFKPKTNYLILLLLIPMLVFCRPVGVFYGIALIYVLLNEKQFKFPRLFLFLAYGSVFAIILFFLPIHYNDFALPVFQGSVICGFPAYPDSVLPEGNYTLAEIYSAFIKEHGFGEFITLSLKKTTTFFTITRPYYSTVHNLINSVYYVFILGGLIGIIQMFRRGSHQLFRTYFTSVLTASLLIVILIYNEWSERFIVPLLPFFILVTFIFISQIRTKRVV
jgi:hypothetical protein